MVRIGLVDSLSNGGPVFYYIPTILSEEELGSDYEVIVHIFLYRDTPGVKFDYLLGYLNTLYEILFMPLVCGTCAAKVLAREKLPGKRLNLNECTQTILSEASVTTLTSTQWPPSHLSYPP